ncbi:F-box domain containing protein [Trema orientale]|nr:F-box domain containing protein [Trema orientale]
MSKRFKYDHHNQEHVANQLQLDTPELPLDMITEILSWMPVNSLLRSKCVSKEWLSLIQDPCFVSIHMRRATATPLSLHDEADLILDDDRFRIIDSFSGLLLKQNIETHKYHLCNPATRQMLHLPDPNHGVLCMPDPNLGTFFTLSAYNSCTHECKLAFTYYSLNKEGVEQRVSEILSVGRDDRWRPLRHQPPREDGKVVMECFLRSEGEFHSVKTVQNGQDLELKVLSFDIWKETFVASTLPRGIFLDLSETFLFLWDSCLAVSEITEEALHVMVLEHCTGGFRWSRSKIVVPLRFLREETYPKEKLVPVRGTSSDLWFQFKEKIEFCYHVETGKIKGTKPLLPKKKKHPYEYRPSLVTLEGMIPEGNH